MKLLNWAIISNLIILIIILTITTFTSYRENLDVDYFRQINPIRNFTQFILNVPDTASSRMGEMSNLVSLNENSLPINPKICLDSLQDVVSQNSCLDNDNSDIMDLGNQISSNISNNLNNLNNLKSVIPDVGEIPTIPSIEGVGNQCVDDTTSEICKQCQNFSSPTATPEQIKQSQEKAKQKGENTTTEKPFNRADQVKLDSMLSYVDTSPKSNSKETFNNYRCKKMLPIKKIKKIMKHRVKKLPEYTTYLRRDVLTAIDPYKTCNENVVNKHTRILTYVWKRFLCFMNNTLSLKSQQYCPKF